MVKKHTAVCNNGTLFRQLRVNADHHAQSGRVE